jgi:hypothetical protein
MGFTVDNNNNNNNNNITIILYNFGEETSYKAHALKPARKTRG